MREQFARLSSDMAEKYESIIQEALGMDRDEVLLIAKDRLSCTIQGDQETVLLDGKPIVTLWPVEMHTKFDGHAHTLVAKRKYKIHKAEHD